MINENLKLSGQLGIVLRDKDGNIKEERTERNLVVTTGLNYIASRMKDASATAMTHMALGSGTTAAAAGQTDLVTLLGSREALDSTTVTANAVAYVASFEAGDATGAVTEAGIFNAASSGTMLCRTKFNVVNKAADDTNALQRRQQALVGVLAVVPRFLRVVVVVVVLFVRAAAIAAVVVRVPSHRRRFSLRDRSVPAAAAAVERPSAAVVLG